MPEYAFDVTLYAVARVTAANEKEARRKMHDVVDCIDIGFDHGGVKLTEASAALGADRPTLFEVDGEAPPFPSEAHYRRAAMDDGWLPQDSDTAQEYCEANDIDASAATDLRF